VQGVALAARAGADGGFREADVADAAESGGNPTAYLLIQPYRLHGALTDIAGEHFRLGSPDGSFRRRAAG
jgi:hypothetical protein